MSKLEFRELFRTKVSSRFGAYASEMQAHFLTLAERFGENRACDIIEELNVRLNKQLKHEATAGHICDLKLSPIGEEIKKQLQYANSFSVETNVLQRLRNSVSRLKVLDCAVDGTPLSQEELESQRPANAALYVATASEKQNAKKFEIFVKF